jgi:hypothetical protein
MSKAFDWRRFTDTIVSVSADPGAACDGVATAGFGPTRGNRPKRVDFLHNER